VVIDGLTRPKGWLKKATQTNKGATFVTPSNIQTVSNRLALLFNSKVSAEFVWLIMWSFTTAASNCDGRNNGNKSDRTHSLSSFEVLVVEGVRTTKLGNAQNNLGLI